MSYQAAMQRDAERLAQAQKRNIAAASSTPEDDVKEDAWASVFASSNSAAMESAEEARRRKLQRKTEKRKEKAQAADANAASLTAYVTGVPKDVSWTAVQNLFSKAGEVRRVKLYKNAAGEPKGDGLVTFATEAGLSAALERGRIDEGGEGWSLFGEPLTIEAASFSAKEDRSVPPEDWKRVVVITSSFSVEEIGAAANARRFLDELEDSFWMECLRFGEVERVQVFAADPQCALAVRFVQPGSASYCVQVMNGRWLNERQLQAGLYDGNRKRAPASSNDDERRQRLGTSAPPAEEEPPPQPAPEPDPMPAPASGATSDGTGAAGSSAPAQQAQTLTIPTDGSSYVKLCNLKGAAERNGQVGVVRAYEPTSGRYTVELREGTRLALRPINLLQMVEVTLAGLDGDIASHNGQRGTIFEYDEPSGCYGVELSREADVAIPVPVGCAVLPDGTVATVVGLQGAAQYNGLLARVCSHDTEASRYLVDIVVDGLTKQLKLRRNNLRLIG